jgi:hypothetical protein
MANAAESIAVRVDSFAFNQQIIITAAAIASQQHHHGKQAFPLTSQ